MAGGPWFGHLDDLTSAERERDGYNEFLRIPALSMGAFTASPGYEDQQQPHAEDEVYVVTEGKATLEISGNRTPVTAGSVAFVPAGIQHRFLDIEGNLRVLVFFAPAQT